MVRDTSKRIIIPKDRCYNYTFDRTEIPFYVDKKNK